MRLKTSLWLIVTSFVICNPVFSKGSSIDPTNTAECKPMLLNSNSVARINTAEWQPYINSKGDPLGSAAELIQLLFSQDNTEVIWQYQNFELAYNQVKKNQKLAAYPYFKTPLREAEVLFSDPIFNVTSHIYYNRQFNEDIQLADLKRFRIGKVTDYSYGTEIDKIVADAKDINSEKQALIELLNNEIDYLPMTESVMNNLLIETFPEQMLLVKPLSAVKGNASLHLIASKTAEGEALKAQLNRLICHVKELDSLQTTPLKLPNKLDVASLTAAEGYPVILGQSQIEGSPDYFTLPQGTKVLVIKWSSKIQAPSKSDRLYKNMMDLSKVVVLNGPHVGKELYIRNMYIELQ